MTWFRLDDTGTFHPKVVAAGNFAWGAFCRAGQWCAKHLTDGKIPADIAHAIAPPRVWIKLARSGLVHAEPQHENATSPKFYALHDYLQWNLSADEVKQGRDRKAKNIRELRARRKQVRTGHVAGNVTGYTPDTEPARNRGPDPDPDPREREREENGTRTLADPEVRAIRDQIRRWPIFASLNAERLADEQGGWMMSKGQKLAWVLDAIDAAATKCADGTPYDRKHSMLVGFMHNAKRPRASEPAPALATATKPIKLDDDSDGEEVRKANEERDARNAQRLEREQALALAAKDKE